MKKEAKKAPSIIIAEDEAIVSRDIECSLSDMGYNVLSISETGEGVIKVAKEMHPSLVIMDILLKGEMDGIEAAQKIKDELDIPVIFLTGFADRAKLKRFKDARPYGFILKPYRQVELQTTIELALYTHHLSQLSVSERQRAEKYLNIAGSILVVLDKEGKITLMNKMAYQLLGYEEGALSGKNWFNACIPRQHRTETRRVFQKIMDGETESVECNENEIVTKSGERKLIRWHNTDLRNADGQIDGTLSAGEEITESRKHETMMNEKVNQMTFMSRMQMKHYKELMHLRSENKKLNEELEKLKSDTGS